MSDGEGSHIGIRWDGVLHEGVDGHPSEVGIQVTVDAQVVEDEFLLD